MITKDIKTKSPYEALFQRIMDQISEDLSTARKHLSKRGIQVYEEKLDDTGLHIKYKIQGYHHQSNHFMHYVKVQVEMYMNYYLGNRDNKNQS